MPLQASELLEPIAGSNPGGASLRYEPIYDQIRRARTEDDDLPAGDWERERKTADHALVIKLSREILATRSKDLQVAAWLTEALLKREGFAGLQTGLEAVRLLIENFWDHLYPEIEDDDLEFRAAPLEWIGQYLDRAVRLVPINSAGHDIAGYRDSRAVGYEEDADTYEKRNNRSAAIQAGKLTAEQFDEAFNATPKAWYKQLIGEMDAALEALRALDAVCQEKFGFDAPRFTPLENAIQEVRQTAVQLLAKKLEKEPDPVEVAEESVAVEASAAVVTEATAGGGPVAPVVAVPGLFAAAPAAASAPAAAPKGRAGAEANVAAAARFLRAESPTDPGPYLMLRGLRWGELRAGGGEVDPMALAAPPTEVRTRLKALLLEEKWSELLEAGEEVMATPFGRGWLDLQRYSVTACEGLGAEYAAVAASIRSELRALLRDLPFLPGFALADDSPTANAETRAWLRQQGLLPDADEAPPEDAVVPMPRSRRDPLERARELVKQGKPDKAVDLLMQEAAQERSQRGRFLRRAQAAAILVDSGKATVAMPILEELVEKLEQHGLEQWEDAETVALPLGLIYRCTVAIEGDASSAYGVYQRVCRLDPMQALRLGPTGTTE